LRSLRIFHSKLSKGLEVCCYVNSGTGRSARTFIALYESRMEKSTTINYQKSKNHARLLFLCCDRCFTNFVSSQENALHTFCLYGEAYTLPVIETPGRARPFEGWLEGVIRIQSSSSPANTQALPILFGILPGLRIGSPTFFPWIKSYRYQLPDL